MRLFKWFKKEQKLDLNNIPVHIGIIMDGNGRWAKRRGLPRSAGHKAGAETLTKILEAAADLGIKYLTVYAFSTENWKRPKEEVDYLMKLLEEYLGRFYEDERHKSVKVNILGDISPFSPELQNGIEKIQEDSKNNEGITLNIALNYGGRNEIHNAIKHLIKDYSEGKVTADDIENLDSELFQNYLYTKNIPDPDLIIRPSGELRLSNFLLYQCAYSELWFAKINWPDFNKQHLEEAIADYQNRNRRFGGV